jgi:hypothetical protein
MSEQATAFLDRAAILGMCFQRKPKVEAVTLPHGTAYVCVMDGFALDSWQDGNYDHDEKSGEWVPKPNARGRLAARCLCDANGARLFQDSEADALGRMDGPTLDEICKVARRINGLAKEAAEKKDEPSPTPTATGDSGAASPSPAASA